MNAYTIRSGVKLAVFAVITLFLTYILAATIGSVDGGKVTAYKADFTDVTGLLPGDDVRIAGVKVGSVQGIKVKDRTLAEVSFGVDRSVPLHTDTHIRVRYRNLVGQRYLAVSEGTAGMLAPKALVPVSQTEPPLDLTALLNGFKPLFVALEPADVNKLSFEMIQVLQGEGGTFDTLLAHTASLTTTLADKDAVIQRVITNLDATLATIAGKDTELSQLVITLQKVVTDLKDDREQILSALGGVNDLVARTTGFLQNVRPPIKDTVTRLDGVAGILDRGKGTIDKELKLLPRKLTAIVRTATYGGWFNFYLCQADGTITLPTGDTIAVKDIVKNNTAACNQDVNAEDVYAGGGSK